MKDSCVRKKNKIVFVFSRILSETYTKGGSMQNFDLRLSKAGHRSSYTRREVGMEIQVYNPIVSHRIPAPGLLSCLLVATRVMVLEPGVQSGRSQASGWDLEQLCAAVSMSQYHTTTRQTQYSGTSWIHDPWRTCLTISCILYVHAEQERGEDVCDWWLWWSLPLSGSSGHFD